LNEPWVVAILGYGQGIFAPGHMSKDEPYLVGHQLLRAHGKAVNVYRKNYQNTQGGVIGITNNADWREPLTNKQEDKDAAQRAMEFFLAWFCDPIYLGDYPQVMKERLTTRLPEFSEEDKKMLLASSDFFGLNHYTTSYASAVVEGEEIKVSVYGNGGIAEDQEVQLHLADDEERIAFITSYLSACHNAIESGVKLKGFFYWSLLDNFEWAHGYSKRFGLIDVNFDTLERTIKPSGIHYSTICNSNAIET